MLALGAVLGAVLLASGCGRPPPAVRHAQGLLQRGDYAGAESAADQAFSQHPGHPELWRVKIQSAFGRGEAGRGVRLYEDWQGRRGRHDATLLRRLALTTLWQGLRVPSAQVRARTIQVIERLELEPLARDVAERIADDSDLVAGAAAVALLRSHPGAPRVATQILQSDDPAARALVVAGIGRKIGAAARAELMPALEDPHPAVRRAAVRAVSAAGSARTDGLGARLVRMARGDADGAVRAAALHALAGLGQDAAVTGRDAARRALADSYAGARLAAVAVLARAGDHEALRRAAAGADAPLAVRAAQALGAAKVPGAAKALAGAVQRALADPSPAVRQAGLNAVQKLADRKQAVALATAHLDDTRWGVRLAAARALVYFQNGPEGGPQNGQAGQTRARAVLAGALKAPGAAIDERLQVEAAADLVRLGDERGARALAALSRSADPAVREAAVRAHGRPGQPDPEDQEGGAGAPRITGGLVAALADDAPLVRVVTAEVLLSIAP